MTRLLRRLHLALRRWESGTARYQALSRFQRSVWRFLTLRLALLVAVTAALPALDLTQDDKRGHLVLGAASSACSMLLLDRIKPDAPWPVRAAVGLAAAVVVGAGKELADSRDPKRHDCDRNDFYATTIGGAAVSLSLCWRF